jgi:hypothetical protein
MLMNFRRQRYSKNPHWNFIIYLKVTINRFEDLEILMRLLCVIKFLFLCE